ncbi:unnamed protein product [Symbiodinium pilosum]|uniref:Uncharacterized protein n=1 Tax=Symbiodinium pilosum TaxID=2952 RepID=A0A812Y388_SYMPI|nr:unnamed protein product [Symbiodinium pilosum]
MDLVIPEHDDKALHQLLDSLGSASALPTLLPQGWDKASALKRLSDHLALIDSEISRKLKGLDDLNSHLKNLQSQERTDMQAAGANPVSTSERVLEVKPPELAATSARPGVVGGHSTPRVYQSSHQSLGMTRQFSPAPQVASPGVISQWQVVPAVPAPQHLQQPQRLQRLASAPAGWRAVQAVQASARPWPGATLLGSGPQRYTLSSADVRSGSAGPAARIQSPGAVLQPPHGLHGAFVAPAPGSPVVVTSVRGGSPVPQARSRCASPQAVAGAAVPGVFARTPRSNAQPSRQWNPQAAPSQVSSRFILVTPQMEAVHPGRCVTPRRVPSRPPAGVPSRVPFPGYTPRR